jgi:hypothetical protein
LRRRRRAPFRRHLDRPVHRFDIAAPLFILWSLTSIALQFGSDGAITWLPSYLVSDLKVNLQIHGLVRRGHLRDDGARQSHHRLPCRHRRTPREQSANALDLCAGAIAVECQDRWNASLGCKTHEAALILLSQIVQLQQFDVTAISQEELRTRMARSTAMMGELYPTDGTRSRPRWSALTVQRWSS